MAKTPRVGEQAPDFELPGTDGPFRLSDHRGERLALILIGRSGSGLRQVPGVALYEWTKEHG